MERRFNNLVLRASEKQFSGYVARFYSPQDAGTEYELLPGLFERIHPKAFDRINRDVVALYNHNPDAPLGRLSSSNLRLKVDEYGLKAALTFNATDPDHKRLRSKILSKTAIGSSFGFFVRKDEFVQDQTKDIRWLLDIDLIEVSMGVTFPAYNSPSIKLRRIEDEDIDFRYSLWLETKKRLQILEKYGIDHK